MSTDIQNIKEDMQNYFTFTFFKHFHKFLSLLPDLFLNAPAAHSKVLQHHKSEPAHLLPLVSTGGQNPWDNVNNTSGLMFKKKKNPTPCSLQLPKIQIQV